MACGPINALGVIVFALVGGTGGVAKLQDA